MYVHIYWCATYLMLVSATNLLLRRICSYSAEHLFLYYLDTSHTKVLFYHYYNIRSWGCAMYIHTYVATYLVCRRHTGSLRHCKNRHCCIFVNFYPNLCTGSNQVDNDNTPVCYSPNHCSHNGPKGLPVECI